MSPPLVAAKIAKVIRRPGGDTTDGQPIVDPRLRERWLAVRREAEHRRRRRHLVLAAALVFLGLLAGLTQSPWLSARHLIVTGARHSGRRLVLAVAGLSDHPPLIDVDPVLAASEVEQIPWVDRAVVTRRWPDVITVTVVERTPVAAASFGPGTAVALVDPTGRVLADVPPADAAGLPVIDALGPPARPGTVVRGEPRSCLAVAAAIPAALAGQITSLSPGPEGTVVGNVGPAITVAFGIPTDLRAKLEDLAAILTGDRPTGPATIDVSVPGAPSAGPAPGSPSPIPG